MANTRLCKFMTVALLAALSPAALADTLTDRAQALLDRGKASDAFGLLEPLESERAGDVDFDLLFGIAAVDSGQNTRGVFALERVLAMQPGNARARAEIARAYLALGETDTARSEFAAVQRQGVPQEVAATIDRFMDAVDRVDASTRTTLRGYIEGSLGYDSNVNAATNKSSVALPGYGGTVVLSPESKATDAWFGALGGGLSIRSPIGKDVAVVAGVSGTLRNNFGASQFDYLTGDAYAGVVLTRDKHVVSLNAQFNQYELASDRYRTASGLSGQWQYNMDARNQLSAFAQYADLRYQTQSVRNAERWVAGGAFAHAYPGGQVAFASVYGVNETPRDGDVPWLGFNGFGVRAGGQLNFNAQTVLFASGSIEYRRYSAEDPAYLATRKETQYDLVVGSNYTPARHWTITPKLSWTFDDSNIELNKYHRESVAVVVRREF